MKFAVVASKQDEAGMTIAGELEKLGEEIIYFEEESIYADEELQNLFHNSNNPTRKLLSKSNRPSHPPKIAKAISSFTSSKNSETNFEKCKDFDFVIFATKHESGKKMPALTVHAPGNWGKADYGGVAGKVCKTSAMFLKLLFNILNDEAKKQKLGGYETTMECTHHGPLIKIPCCFIEIGSSADEWGDEKAGKVIAMTIKRAINNIVVLDSDYESVIGIGGPHYCPNFNKIQLNSEYAVGHVIPQYCLPLTSDMIREAVGGTFEEVKKAVVDWKGCGCSAEREKVIDLLKQEGLEVLRSDKVEK